MEQRLSSGYAEIGSCITHRDEGVREGGCNLGFSKGIARPERSPDPRRIGTPIVEHGLDSADQQFGNPCQSFLTHFAVKRGRECSPNVTD